MNVLIDTCVIIDTFQQRQPFCAESNRIFLAAATNQINGCITSKAIADIYYLTHKYLHDDAKTRKALKTVFSVFAVLDTTANDCFNALSSPMKDYEDAIMAETAKRENMDCIVTRNVKDYADARVRVLSPAELLEMIENEG